MVWAIESLSPVSSVHLREFFSRDAISKALYQRLFSWLVHRVNTVVRGRDRDSRTTSIALLDIFGFEVSTRMDIQHCVLGVLSGEHKCHLWFCNTFEWCLSSLTTNLTFTWNQKKIIFAGLSGEQLWTAEHQLRKWDAAVLLQQARVQTGAGRILPRTHRLDHDPVPRQSTHHRSDRQEAEWNHPHPGWRKQFPQGTRNGVRV